MDDIRELLSEFIEFLKEKDDVFYAFDKPDKAIDEYIEQRDQSDQWLGD